MQEQNNNLDMLFDSMLGEAVESELDESCQSPDTAEETEYSAEHNRKMAKLFKEYDKKTNTRKFSQAAMRAACVILAVVVVSGAAVFSVDAWRMKLMNFIFDPDNPGTHINFNDNGGTTYTDEYVRLGYVPMGFEMTDRMETRNCNSLYFESADKYFSFTSEISGGMMSVDTEDAIVEEVIIKGHKCIYSTNDNVNILVWHDDYNVYTISGTISKNEIIKIAEYTNIFYFFGEK